ncbi:MAG: aldo/keto reductase [Armatimonadetes bacterium]|nr:aldo/keto reductase [Armatimonadota bacterium]
MKYGNVAGVSKPVSKLVLGTMIIHDSRQTESNQLLDDALDLGVSTLDLAHVYGGGGTERAVGNWLRERGNREQVCVMTKGAHPNGDRRRVTPYDIGSDLLDSLARLKTDYVDIYLLHRDDEDVPVGEIVDALCEHQKAGRIRAFGGSNWTHQRLAAANDYAAAHGLTPMAASSPHYSLAEQVDDPWGPGCVGISGPGQVEARAWYQTTGMPIFAYSSLGRGFFSGRITRANFEATRDQIDGACLRAYCHEVNFQRLDRAEQMAAAKGLTVAQVATAYVLNQPLNLYPLIGAASRAELEANVAAAEVVLTEAECAWLDLRD